MKPYVLTTLGRIFYPIRVVGRFLMNAILVPVYHLAYTGRRRLEKLWRPAKNRAMYFLTNRYVVHVVIIFVAFTAVFINIQTNEVRAESFGERSLLYGLISEGDNRIIEEYASDAPIQEYIAMQYREHSALSAYTRGVDAISRSNTTAISFLGGGTLLAPMISDEAESLAPREEIETYIVEDGDTLSTIAAKFNISLNTLLWANGLTVRSTLRPGNELTILPVTGVMHTVASGDTLSKIADRYSVDTDAILSFNKLASATDINSGEKLVVPGGVIAAPAPTRTTTSLTGIFTAPATTATTIAPAPTTSLATGSMVWPTDLRIITQYYGWRHTGIDIDCHFTHDNYAADDGIVTFVGWKGDYGYTVEINHGNGMMTRYAHHANLYVSAGQSVAKGTALGRCGTTGRSTGTHLHFEVIVNGKFRNPLEYIR